MKTEYLISIDKRSGVATSCDSFNHLLMSNNGIEIEDGKIEYKKSIFKYELNDVLIHGTEYICYHVTIYCDISASDFNVDNINAENYLEFLRIIRKTFSDYAEDFEILWDDISYVLSQKAYPLIYEIENLMRKLLTKFMLINVGSKWEKENIPAKINKSKNKEKDINLGNGLLYKLDFIELSTFLFEPYSLKSNINDFKNKIDSKKDIPYALLENYIQKSNWERYFSNIVSVENEHLSKIWKELYDLRCKIAHNNLFGVQDYNKVKSIVDDLKPKFEIAISKLDIITVDDSGKEVICENLAKTSNEQIGCFILKFNELNDAIMEFLSINAVEQFNNKMRVYPFQKLICDLRSGNLINDNQYKSLKYLSYSRNRIVHQSHISSEYNIDKMISDIDTLLTYFQTTKTKGVSE